jgi:AcrR family transcriptional regulator
MTVYAGRGDPRRSMELLWGGGEAPRRGPKPGLNTSAVAAAAIELADAEGLGALSMRKVAERLGRSAMSLYTYVPGKAELLDLMLDTALGELPTAYPRDGGWRAAVEASARDGWDFYQRHPWVLQISGSRALLGPHELDLYETQLRLVDGLGLDGVEMTRVVGVVAGFVRGSAKAVSDARTAEQATGVLPAVRGAVRQPVGRTPPYDHPARSRARLRPARPSRRHHALHRPGRAGHVRVRPATHARRHRGLPPVPRRLGAGCHWRGRSLCPARSSPTISSMRSRRTSGRRLVPSIHFRNALR